MTEKDDKQEDRKTDRDKLIEAFQYWHSSTRTLLGALVLVLDKAIEPLRSGAGKEAIKNVHEAIRNVHEVIKRIFADDGKGRSTDNGHSADEANPTVSSAPVELKEEGRRPYWTLPPPPAHGETGDKPCQTLDYERMGERMATSIMKPFYPKRGVTKENEAVSNGFATAGMILGIVSVFFWPIGLLPILAIVFSGIGLSKVRDLGACRAGNWSHP